MPETEHKLIISRLVFDLTVAEGFSFNLDALLERLHGVLHEHSRIPIEPHGTILLLNRRRRFLQVAQFGMPCYWDSEFDWNIGLFADGTVFDAARFETLTIPDTVKGRTTRTPMFILPLHIDGQGAGYVLFQMPADYAPDEEDIDFMTDLSHALSSLVNRAMILETLQVREFELSEARTNAIRSLGVASEYRDNETGWHIMRMTNFAQSIAKAMDLPDEMRDILYVAAPMHDVGKIGIPDSILFKPAKLDPDEFETMKTHTEIGVTILTGNDILISAARDIAGSHHERWDGTGYPKGIKGEAIPLLARICSVADVFDALTSSRPYKGPWPVEEATDWILSQSGSHFDPSVVAAFLKAMPEILRIRQLYRDDIIDPAQEIKLPPLERGEEAWVAWDDGLSVGIDVIDEHHRYLFDLVNDLFEVVRKRRGAREMARVLKALEAYSKVHFRAEEQMMAHHGHPRLDRQEHQHHAFEVKLGEFYEELHTNPIIAPFDMLHYLRVWLVHHISEEDAELRSLVAA